MDEKDNSPKLSEHLTEANDLFFSQTFGEKIRGNWEIWFESWEQCNEWCMRHGL